MLTEVYMLENSASMFQVKLPLYANILMLKSEIPLSTSLLESTFYSMQAVEFLYPSKGRVI